MADHGKDFFEFTIDGRKGRVPKGTLIITAADRMGIHIPRFCHHEKLVPYAGCRICLVEIENMPKLMASCSTQIQEGMVIKTNTEKVEKNRRAVLEFILINHPMDCPICDKGGECDLQELYYEFSGAESRFTEDKIFKQHNSINPTIKQDSNRCLLCKRCVRYAYEIATDDLIVYRHRSVHTEVTTFNRRQYESVYSGNITELCPVGALSDQIFRFRCRPWELNHKASICVNCSQNCHIDIQHRNGEIMRIFSSDFEPINESWLCDRGRFHHQFVSSEEGIRQPLEKVDGKWEAVSWKHAFELIVTNLQKTIETYGSGAIAGVIENDHTLEEFLAFRRLMWDTIQTPHFDAHPSMKGIRAEKADYFIRNLPTFEQVATSDAVLNIGCDIVSEAPLLALKIRKTMMNSGMKPFNLTVIPTSTGKLMPETIIPLDQFASVLVSLIRRLVNHDRIPDTLKEKVSTALENIPQVDIRDVDIALDSIESVIKTSRTALIVGRWILKHDSVYTSLTKILIELFEKIQQIPVIMPFFEGGNAVGAEMMKVYPMLSSAGAGDMEFAGGQGADDVINAALHERIKTMLVFSHRFGNNLPEYEWKRGTEKIDFLVWADYFHSPINESADLLLPLQSPFEKNGHVVNNEGRFDKLNRAVKLKGDTLPTFEIIAKLARGLGNTDRFKPDDLLKEILADDRFGEQLSTGGFIFTGVKRDYIDRLKTLSMPDIPEIKKDYPLLLITHQPFWHGDMSMIESSILGKRLPKFACVMNTNDAVERNLKNNQKVEVSTEHGSLKAVLKVDQRMPSGYVSLPEGYIDKRLGVLYLSGKKLFRVRVGLSYSKESNVSHD